MANVWAYSKFPQYVSNKQIDFDTDVIKVALFTSSFTPNQDSDTLYSGLSNEVANGNGYTTGGATLANASISQSSNVVTLDGDDVVWSSSTITARYGVIYESASSLLIAYVDFLSDYVSNASDFTIAWNASGILTFTVTADV